MSTAEQNLRAPREDIYAQARRNGAWSEEFIAGFGAATDSFQQVLAAQGDPR